MLYVYSTRCKTARRTRHRQQNGQIDLKLCFSQLWKSWAPLGGGNMIGQRKLLYFVYYDIVSDTSSGIICSIQNIHICTYVHYIHIFSHSFWHILAFYLTFFLAFYLAFIQFWHSIWHSFLYTLWHSIWHLLWHLAGILSDSYSLILFCIFSAFILALYLASILTFSLPCAHEEPRMNCTNACQRTGTHINT